MPVVMTVLVAITHHASVIASMECRIDVCKVVTGHLTLRIDPNFTPIEY